MKFITSFENPPIPMRKFDWCAFDEDQLGGVCRDPECDCRAYLVRGWGETEEQAIHAFVDNLLEQRGISVSEIMA